MKNVINLESKMHKFVLIRLEGQVYLAAGPLYPEGKEDELRHKDLVEEFRIANGLSSIDRHQVEGGGQIDIQSEYNTISLYNRSSDYGKPDYEAAAEIVRPLFPDIMRIQIIK